jgi:DNA/RNA endonuclease G (NUC1)
LEEKIRRESTEGSKYIIVGPIYENYTTTIGDNIAVPTKLFRIIIDAKTKNVRVYIIPNTDEEISAENLSKFLSTLDELERLTGFSAFVAK